MNILRKGAIDLKLKELCEELGYKYDKKNPKRSLEEIKKTYVIKQDGRDYSVVRELSTEERREIKTYVKMRGVIKDTIFATLSMVDNNKIGGTINDFYELFAIVNNNYSWFKYNNMNNKKREYIATHNIKEENICIYHEFSKEVDIMFHKTVKECLEQLEKEMLIYINKYLTFVYRDENGYRHSKTASDKDTELLLEAGREVMNKYGYESYDKISFYDKNKIKNEICKIVGIEYFYNYYEIILNNKFLNFDCGDCIDLKKKVNDLAVKKLSTSNQGVLKEYDIEMLNDCIDTLIKI